MFPGCLRVLRYRAMAANWIVVPGEGRPRFVVMSGLCFLNIWLKMSTSRSVLEMEVKTWLWMPSSGSYSNGSVEIKLYVTLVSFGCMWWTQSSLDISVSINTYICHRITIWKQLSLELCVVNSSITPLGNVERYWQLGVTIPYVNGACPFVTV